MTILTEQNETSVILLDPPLDDRLHHREPVCAWWDGPKVNGSIFKAIQLIKATFNWDVTNEVEHILIFRRLLLVKLK